LARLAAACLPYQFLHPFRLKFSFAYSRLGLDFLFAGLQFNSPDEHEYSDVNEDDADFVDEDDGNA